MLSRPWAGWQAASGLFAQITQGAGAVGIILVVRQHSGSLALAGAVVGVVSIAAAAARPAQGRIIDRHGSAAIMAVCGVIHPAALLAIVGLSQAGAPGSLLIAAGVLGGLTLPPVSTSMRVVWGDAIGAENRMSAYSLIYLIQELAILAGPLILSAVIAISSASLALVVIALLSAGGTLGFAASVRERGADREPHPQARAGVFGSVAVRMLVAIAFLLGGVIGGIEVAAPAFAISHQAPAAGGLLIASLSVGGIVGAAVYGNRRWRSTAAARLLVLLGTLTAAVLLGASATGALEVGALLLVAGVCLNPALTTITLLVDQHTPGRTAAEAFGWLSTGFAAGGGAASAIAGAVAGRHDGARPAFLVAAVAGGLATGFAALARRRFGVAPPPTTA